MGKDKKTPQGAPQAVRSTCAKKDCKKDDQRFGFCLGHFEEFKFGLITKSGDYASDYEKKLAQYERFKENKKISRKAA